MDIVESTRSYERWLKGSFTPLAADLGRKHEQMAADAFTFLRGTFYRWAQLWEDVPSKVRRAPDVLGVGDAHVENFGTWRDSEGRLVWGVNDFDEAARMPYTNDLVRLATSAALARVEGLLALSPQKICPAILIGYEGALRQRGRAIVLDSGPVWLRDMAWTDLRNPDKYWRRLLALPPWRGTVPRRARTLLEAIDPPARLLRIIHRVSGVGSLGRPRLTALYVCSGGLAAREVKARAPSAWQWAQRDVRESDQGVLPHIWRQAVRSQDPFLYASRRWLCRRLAPDCSRIDLASIPHRRNEAALLTAMGWELANIHLGSRPARRLLDHLGTLDAHWLPQAATRMAVATRHDFAQWVKTERH